MRTQCHAYPQSGPQRGEESISVTTSDGHCYEGAKGQWCSRSFARSVQLRLYLQGPTYALDCFAAVLQTSCMGIWPVG